MGPGEVLECLQGAADTDGSVRSTVGFLASMFLSGEIPTFVRPMGGGSPEPLAPARWEVDDPTGRFITSAVDPAQWADPAATPTHWIFVDTPAFDAFMEDWCRGEIGQDDELVVTERPARDGALPARAPVAAPRSLIRRSEVERRSGLSRSQIYKRMSAGTFPPSVQLGVRMVGWYEDEIDGWLANLPSTGGLATWNT